MGYLGGEKLNRGKTKKIFYSFIATLLILSTFTPYSVVAAAEELEVTADKVVLTEKEINNGETKITLTIPTGKEWVKNFSVEKSLALIDSMVADVEINAWSTYKNKITVEREDDQTLAIKFPQDTNYKILANQTITINMNGSLIENWTGTVKPVELKINAKSRISIGGNIFNATANDLKSKTGKTIELNLLNAEWKTDELSTWTNLSKVLNNFVVGTSTPWNVMNEMKSKDPKDFIEFTNENSTMKIKLNSITSPILDANVKFNTSTLDTSVYKLINLGEELNSGEPLDFKIYGETGITVIADLKEENINATNTQTIELTLQNADWNTLTTAKQELLIDALQPNNQKEEWNKIKANLIGKITLKTGDPKTLVITIPQTEGYYLTGDQKISLKIPQQLLKNVVDLPKVEFTVEAEPKVLISGSATPSISHEDLIKGGKTIELTLVNTTWRDNVVSNSQIREELLGLFNWNDINMKAEEVKSKAVVKKTNDKKIIITLPTVNSFKIGLLDLKLTLDANKFTNDNIQTKPIDIFTISTSKKATAKVTGLEGKTEFDMVKEGNELTIKLTNDMWVSDIESKGHELLDGFKIAGDPAGIIHTAIKRKSDTELTITLEKINKRITKDENYDLTISKDLLTISSEPIEVTGAFKVLDVQAELSGTASTGLDAVDLQKGGKTIILTLKNAKFKADTPKSELVKVLSSTDSLSSAVKNALANSSDSKTFVISNNKLTIKLPAIEDKVSGKLSFTVPLEIVENAPYSIEVKDNKSITVGAIATVSSNKTILSNESIINGTTALSLTLSGAKWDPTIVSNASKKMTLLKGLTVEDQTNEWTKVTNAIKTSGNFTLNPNGTTLTIQFPAVRDYSIIRQQDVLVKIPKSILEGYNYDVEMSGKITITSSELSEKKPFTEVLPDLPAYIEDNGGIENVLVSVPEKKVDTITVSTVDIPGNGSITTVEVSMNKAIDRTSLNVSVQAGGTTVEKTGDSSLLYVFTNLDSKGDIQITVSSGEQTIDIFKKVGKGNKTYNELPKKPLAGSYSLYSLLTDKSLLKEIFKYYSPSELEIGTRS